MSKPENLCRYVLCDDDMTLVCREHTNPHFVVLIIPEHREKILAELTERGEVGPWTVQQQLRTE